MSRYSGRDASGTEGLNLALGFRVTGTIFLLLLAFAWPAITRSASGQDEGLASLQPWAWELSPLSNDVHGGFLITMPEIRLVPHAAISILSDREFTPVKGVVAGSGIEDDPYIMEGWDIHASVSWVPVVFPTGTSRAGILIANTTAHLIIRHVNIHDGGNPNLGIVLWNATNVTVESSRVWNGNTGVFLIASKNTKIVSNEFFNLIRGIVLWGGPYQGTTAIGNHVYQNTIHELSVMGIDLNNASDNTVRNNTIHRAFWGIGIERGSSGNMAAWNHVSDSLVGIVVFSESHDNTIADNRIEITEGFTGIGGVSPVSGISIGTYSWRNVAEYNEIRGFARGINLGWAFSSNVSYNSVQATEVGVLIRFASEANRVTGNLIIAPVGISICSLGANFLAPPPNDLRSTERPIEHCPGWQAQG